MSREIPNLLVVQAREGQALRQERTRIRELARGIAKPIWSAKSLDGIGGTLWLGSPFNIPRLDTETEQPGLYDHLARVVPLARQVMEREIPTMGICFGHQTLAYANGGTVRNIRGESGIKSVALTEDPLFAGLPNPLRMKFSHEDSVTVVPEGAVILGKTDRDPYSIIRYRNVISLQGHPEREGPDPTERIIVNFIKSL